jgi:hypothetical protein
MERTKDEWFHLALLGIAIIGTIGLASYAAQAQPNDLVVGGLQIVAASSLGYSGMIVGLGMGGSLGSLLFAPIGLIDRSCLTSLEGHHRDCVLPWMIRGFELGSKLGMLVGLSSGAALGAQGVLLMFGRSGNLYGAFVGAIIGGFIGLGADSFRLSFLEMNIQSFHVELRWYGLRTIILTAIGATIGSYWR